MKNKIKIIAVFIIMCCIILSCDKHQQDESNTFTVITLPETKHPRTLNQWAITKFDLLKIRQEPFTDAKVINHLKLGSVIEVLKKEDRISVFDNINDYWYYINYDGENGWIFGAYLEIFNSKEEAVKRSEELLFGIDDRYSDIDENEQNEE